MEQGDQQKPINTTVALEILSPYLNNPHRTITRIEAFVAVAAALLFFQFIFGSFRRRSRGILVQGGLWVAYTLIFPLITYTLGQMQSSPVKSGLYPVWATSLFLVAGCTNSITAYDLNDNKQWKRLLLEFLQYYLYLTLINQLLWPVHAASLQKLNEYWNHYHGVPPINIPNLFLFIGVSFTHLVRVVSCWMVNYSDPSKVVTDYMRDYADLRRGCAVQEADPVSLKGYRYLVHWPGYKAAKRDRRDPRPSYRNRPLAKKDIVTVDMIWEKFSSTGSGSNVDTTRRLKDVCLSYALSHLLKRRFFGMECAEANLPETRRLVFEGLLSNDGYARAFRVIEVELGFLYDFFFTKYASIFEMEISFFLMVILKVIFTFILGAFVLLKSPTVETLNPVITVKTGTVDAAITVFILGTFLIVEVLQSVLYLGSDWAIVSLACRNIRGGCCSAIHKPIGFLHRNPLFGYWENKLGQYSVIDGWCMFIPNARIELLSEIKYLHNFVFLKVAVSATQFMVKKFSECVYPRNLDSVHLTDTVKKVIVSSLRRSVVDEMIHITNGTASLERNGVRDIATEENSDSDHADLAHREVKEKTQTEIMLTWHIATEYCKIPFPNYEESEEAAPASSSAEQEENSLISDREYRDVAIKLSRYCAYLMSSVPELLPGNFADTKFVFYTVIREAIDALGEGENMKMTKKERLKAMAEGKASSIFVRGLKLGTKLESLAPAQRWKVMAEFWAETLLYVAPSNNVEGHMRRLAEGGEFLTHVWALLTHAGVLTRNRREESREAPEEPV